jgi:hypothetical protein
VTPARAEPPTKQKSLKAMKAAKTAHNLGKRPMQTRKKKEKPVSAGENWLECPDCEAVGIAGTMCADCEGSGMVHSEPRKEARETAWVNKRVLWMSRVGQLWRDGFKQKVHETLHERMMVMIVKGPSDRLFQIGLITAVMKKYVDVDYFLEEEKRVVRQRVHMHSILVIHRGVEITVDENGVLYVEQREEEVVLDC